MSLLGIFAIVKVMKKLKRIYESQLSIQEFSLPPGGEWAPQSSCWSLIQVGRGTGYYLRPPSSRELETGTVLLVAGHQQGSIRASQLGGLLLFAFNVIPARLPGLITQGEQDFFERAASRKEFPPRIFPPQSPVAVRMKDLCAGRTPADGLLFRLNLLQIFAGIFGDELQQAVTLGETADARERLRLLLQRMPMADLQEMNFSDLARMAHCTSRHLGRIFYDVVGMSFREKRNEIRLARARDLLATSKTKVVEVALVSGYKSLSLFNLMFTRRFGTSPGKWRQKHANINNGGSEGQRIKKRGRLRSVDKTARAFLLNPPATLAGRRNTVGSVRVKLEAVA